MPSGTSPPAVTIRRRVSASRDYEARSTEIHGLLHSVGAVGFASTSSVFAGRFECRARTGPRVLAGESGWYEPDRSDLLPAMLQFAGLDKDHVEATTVSWDGHVVTVSFDTAGHRPAFLFELTPLGDGCGALTLRLYTNQPYWADFTYEDACTLARDIPDPIAGLVANVFPPDPEPGDEDADDPRGLISFAEGLCRAGVANWDARSLAALTTVADRWTGTSAELLDVATALGLGA